MPAPSTLGTFLRSFSWAHARQLDGVAGRLLARAWAAGGGPGDSPLIIDVDSRICEVYGAKKQGARYGYTKTRGYHPLRWLPSRSSLTWWTLLHRHPYRP